MLSGVALIFTFITIKPSDAIRLLCPWDFPGKNTGVGCRFLLQYWDHTASVCDALILMRAILVSLICRHHDPDI